MKEAKTSSDTSLKIKSIIAPYYNSHFSQSFRCIHTFAVLQSSLKAKEKH